MASITTEPNGRRTVQFVGGDGKRRSVRLGRVPLKLAQAVQVKIEALNAAAIALVSVGNETAQWLGGIDDVLYGKLVAVGLCELRQTEAGQQQPATVAAFLNEYLAGRTDIRPSTAFHLKQARDKLLGFLGADKPLADVCKLDAENFRRHLRETLADNTTRRMVSRARQFFAAALHGRLIAENPFAHLKGLNVRAVKERQAFIDREATYKLLDAAPDAEWRAIIALARFGGVRVPSELQHLRWSDVEWTGGKYPEGSITIASPKTAHCGKASRVAPLFPELRPWLREAFDAAWNQTARCRSL
jgi:hypothetical protein